MKIKTHEKSCTFKLNSIVNGFFNFYIYILISIIFIYKIVCSSEQTKIFKLTLSA